MDQIGQSEHAITDGELTHGFRSVGLFQAGVSGSVGICTGTLIGDYTVLTAAHCIEPGETHVFHLEGVRYAVERVIQHEGWDPDDPQFPNDIGIGILAEAPSVEPSAIAVALPAAGAEITLVGFGCTSESCNDAGTKRVTTNLIGQVTERRFSYSGTGNGVGSTCNGDSGGPAFAEFDGKLYQVGVTSAGVAPCGTLAWDTRVDIFRDWLMANAAGDVYRHDMQAPQVVITSPIAGHEVAGRVTVTADATDDEAVAVVALWVAGREVARRSTPPFRFTIDLAPGPQTIEVISWDAAGNEGRAAVHVESLGSHAGTYGAQCRDGLDCESGVCGVTAGLRGRTMRSCTRVCAADSDCPAGASCGLSEQGRAICIPASLLSAEGQDDDQLAGCSLGSDARRSAPPWSTILALLLLVVLRRR